MKKWAIGALVAAFLCGAAGKPDAPPNVVRFYGIGSDSCAHWLSSQGTREEGTAWMMGFWSGMNVANTKSHLVGTTIDGDAVVGETRLICEKEPSTHLNEAVGRVYSRFQQANK